MHGLRIQRVTQYFKNWLCAKVTTKTQTFWDHLNKRVACAKQQPEVPRLPKRRKKKTVILVKNLFLDILQSFKQISKRWRKKVSDRGVSHDPKWPSCSTFYIRKAQLSNKSQNAVNVITSFKNKKSTLFYEIPLRFEILKVRAEIKLFGSRAYSSFWETFTFVMCPSLE